MDKSLIYKNDEFFMIAKTDWTKNMIGETKKWIEFCEIF